MRKLRLRSSRGSVCHFRLRNQRAIRSPAILAVSNVPTWVLFLLIRSSEIETGKHMSSAHAQAV
jgi:hypothetical protein